MLNISDENLVGWLCVMRWQFTNGNNFTPIPGLFEEFLLRSWITVDYSDPASPGVERVPVSQYLLPTPHPSTSFRVLPRR